LLLPASALNFTIICISIRNTIKNRENINLWLWQVAVAGGSLRTRRRRRKHFFIFFWPREYNNYGATIIILYGPRACSDLRRRGKRGKNRCGRQLCGGPPTAADITTTSTDNTDTAWFAADVIERTGARHRCTGHRPVAAAICGCVVGGTGCMCRVCVRACAVLTECDANIRENIISNFFVLINDNIILRFR